jgi:CheY-like chemotaxis protein
MMGDSLSVQKQTILIVDDKTEVLDVLATIVAELGYSAVCASDGNDALKIIEWTAPLR